MADTGKRHERKSLSVAFFCAAVYFCSYLTRKNFAVALVAITEATGLSDSAIAAVPVCLFITYGIGQTVNGAIGDHIPPQYLITGGMLLSATCNFVLPLCSGVPAMCIIWGINGFAQAMLWPPISKIMIYTYSGVQYGTASMIVSLSASLATVTGYLYIPAVLSVTEWQAVFYVAATVVVVCAVVWFFYSFRKDFINKESQQSGNCSNVQKNAKKFPRAVALTLALILLVVVAVGMLRDGVETWMPTFIKESFGNPAEKSILISVLLALFSCLCIVLTTIVYRKFFGNELFFCAAVFLLATVFGGLLLASNGKNMLLSTINICRCYARLEYDTHCVCSAAFEALRSCFNRIGYNKLRSLCWCGCIDLRNCKYQGRTRLERHNRYVDSDCRCRNGVVGCLLNTLEKAGHQYRERVS